MPSAPHAVSRSILCVDDNPAVADAVRELVTRSGEFTWCGSLPDASGVVAYAQQHQPFVTLLDVDMPGPPSFDIVARLSRETTTRSVIFSGNVTRDLVQGAIDHGAWGFFLKSDGNEALMECLRQVAAGELAFSPEPALLYQLI